MPPFLRKMRPLPEEAQNTLTYRRAPFMYSRCYPNTGESDVQENGQDYPEYSLPVPFSVLFAVPYTRMIQGI